MEKVIAIFDIGKTNKKILLFNEELKLVSQQEKEFPAIVDDDNFECDDIDRIVEWMKETVKIIVTEGQYELVAMNFSTYGATLAFISGDGERVSPLYNYLKPMPQGVAEPVYAKYGGIEEFCRCTASPAMGMLNSGLQIRWLKIYKPEVFVRVKNILHFPQYLSYCFTGKVTSEYTSIGCHTALWNFDIMSYHPWLSREGIQLPDPASNSTLYNATVAGKAVSTGIGIHDSSASIVPYLHSTREPFILLSTGTWCICMNPFNNEPLTREQLKKDTLCYISTSQQQVKSSRLFLGHIHDINLQHIAAYYNTHPESFRDIKANPLLVKKLFGQYSGRSVFFPQGVPEKYFDETVDLSLFSDQEEAYHQLIIDLAFLVKESLQLVIPENDKTRLVYISGGFARNEIFVRLLSTLLPGKRVFTSEIDNATALGAALSVYSVFNNPEPLINMGLKESTKFELHSKQTR